MPIRRASSAYETPSSTAARSAARYLSSARRFAPHAFASCESGSVLSVMLGAPRARHFGVVGDALAEPLARYAGAAREDLLPFGGADEDMDNRAAVAAVVRYLADRFS